MNRATRPMSEDHDLLKVVYRIANEDRPVIFVFGSGLTMPPRPDGKGVPGTQGMISLMQERVHGVARERLRAASNATLQIATRLRLSASHNL